MAIIASDAFIAAHPSFFPRFYRVRDRATEWANANRSAAIDILARSAGGIDAKLVEPLYPAPFGFDQTLTPDVLSRVKEVESFLRSLEITRNPVDVDAWMNRAAEYKR
jgi:ABC-type nitrate/sulfonate/bicarbonate transport system substrate-binding protein